MQDPKHSFPVFTPFGGSYIREHHGRAPQAEHSKGWGRWAIVVIALLLGITTAAAAVMASGRSTTPVPALWKQNPPALFLKAPHAEDFRVLLF